MHGRGLQVLEVKRTWKKASNHGDVVVRPKAVSEEWNGGMGSKGRDIARSFSMSPDPD